MSRSRLTPLDASFLEVESATAHMHVGWAALFAAPENGSKPTFAELRDHVAARLGRAPRYRQKLVGVPLGLNESVWADDPGFDIARHVRRSDATELQSLADQVMSAQLVRDRPLWELWIADRLADGRIGVVGKVHHCMVDGVAAVELAALVLDPAVEAEEPEPDGWRPAALPGRAKLMAEGALDRAGQLAGLARLPLDLVRRPAMAGELLDASTRALRAVRHSLAPAPQSFLNEAISPRRHLAWARRPLEDLREIKNHHGGTVNDVVLAATAGGVRSLTAGRGGAPQALKAMVPVSLREDGAAGELGNRISFLFVDLPCDEPDPVRRLRQVKSAMDERKDSGEPEGAGAMLDAVDYAPRTIQHALSRVMSSARTFNLVVSNIPGPREPLYMRGCRLEEVYPVVPLADDHALSVGMTTVGDDAFFGVYADPDLLGDSDRLATAIGEAVDELRPRREGVRPSGRNGGVPTHV